MADSATDLQGITRCGKYQQEHWQLTTDDTDATVALVLYCGLREIKTVHCTWGAAVGTTYYGLYAVVDNSAHTVTVTVSDDAASVRAKTIYVTVTGYVG